MPKGICDVSLEYTYIYFRGDLFPGCCLSHGALSRTPSAFYSRGAAPHPVLFSGRCPVPRPLSIPGAPPRTPVSFLERKRSKELAFFYMAGSFIFGEIGIEKK